MSSSLDSTSLITPQYWDYLTKDDQEEYLKLKKRIAKIVIETSKVKFCNTFIDIAGLIEKYVGQDTSSHKYRSLVCGYFWVNDRLAINTRQIISLVGKCKSSINSGFQALGFKVIPMDAECSIVLMKLYPFLKNNVGLTRQWTLREKVNQSQTKPLSVENLLKQLPAVSLFDEISSNLTDDLSSSNSEYTTPTPDEQRAEREEFSFEPEPFPDEYAIDFFQDGFFGYEF